jgi:hypothetical protein
VEGILLAFDGSNDGTSVYDMDVVAGIAAAVTNIGKTKVYMVANSSQKPAAESIFQNAGVDMALVEWVNENTNSVWVSVSSIGRVFFLHSMIKGNFYSYIQQLSLQYSNRFVTMAHASYVTLTLKIMTEEHQ